MSEINQVTERCQNLTGKIMINLDFGFFVAVMLMVIAIIGLLASDLCEYNKWFKKNNELKKAIADIEKKETAIIRKLAIWNEA